MSSNDLMMFAVFLWALLSAWAVIQGLENG